MGPYTMIRKLERHGVSATQLEAALGEVDAEEVRQVFDGEMPLRQALAESANAERTDRRRYYAYLVLAATPRPELARRVGAEGYLRRQRAAVERQVRRSARDGITDTQLQQAIRAIGVRPVAEALAAPAPFGAWARDHARLARRRRERLAYAHLAAAEIRRVRGAVRDARQEGRGAEDSGADRDWGEIPAGAASVEGDGSDARFERSPRAGEGDEDLAASAPSPIAGGER